MSCIRLISLLAITLISMQSLASAHFTLTYPSTRGFDETKEATAPCGGYNTASSQRVQMPINSSFIEINSGHTSYTYVINALAKNDPTTSDFSNATNLVQVAQGGRAYPQAACLPLAFNDIKSNTNVTLQIVYNGGDGLLYQVNKMIKYKLFLFQVLIYHFFSVSMLSWLILHLISTLVCVPMPTVHLLVQYLPLLLQLATLPVKVALLILLMA